MTTYTYERVETRGYKRGPCTICGKHAERSMTFGQTLNPFNKNADGEVKIRAEIMCEITAQRNAWQAEPVTHARCDGGAS
jgi:hypothetical protein